MTKLEMLLTVLAVALGTQITRWLPFLLFPENRQPPAVVRQLGQLLPPAVMGLLVVYCLKSTPVLESPHGLPEMISVALIIALHKWKHNTLLSIVSGTVVYMLLIQLVFA